MIHSPVFLLSLRYSFSVHFGPLNSPNCSNINHFAHRVFNLAHIFLYCCKFYLYYAQTIFVILNKSAQNWERVLLHVWVPNWDLSYWSWFPTCRYRPAALASFRPLLNQRVECQPWESVGNVSLKYSDHLKQCRIGWDHNTQHNGSVAILSVLLNKPLMLSDGAPRRGAL
jgi:hypothetical protein